MTHDLASSATRRLALGTMLFGTRVDDRTAFEILDRFVDRGGQWIDTADCYAFWLSDHGRGGDSEAVIGRWLGARPGVRDRVLLSTKVGAEPSGAQPPETASWRGWPENRQGLSRNAVVEATSGSLRRLGIDRIDLLWLHQEDRGVPIEQTVDALGELIGSGTVDRVGASNHPAWRVEAARRHAADSGGPMLDAVQLAMSYLRVRPGARPEGNDHEFGQASGEQLDHAQALGLEVWAYTPLLRGAYDRAERPVPEVFEHPGTTRRLKALNAVAGELGVAPSQVVLSWLAGGARPVRPIVGVSSVEQLDSALDGAQLELPVELRARLDDVEP